MRKHSDGVGVIPGTIAARMSAWMRRVVMSLACASLAVASAAARAEDASPDPSSEEEPRERSTRAVAPSSVAASRTGPRRTWLAGLTLAGVGRLAAEGEAEIIAQPTSYFAGRALTARIAIVVDVTGPAFTPTSSREWFYGAYTVGAMYWLDVRSRAWLKAGVGVAVTGVCEENSCERQSGLAGIAAAGYELVRWGPVAFDAQLRVGGAATRDRRELFGHTLVGLNWY